MNHWPSTRFLQVGSQGRDALRDEQRFAPLRAAVRSALSRTEDESEALASRVEELRARCAELIGNDCGCENQRDAGDEEALAVAERKLIASCNRLSSVEEALALIQSIDRLLGARGGVERDGGAVPERTVASCG